MNWHELAASAWTHLEPLVGAALGSALVSWRKWRGWDSRAFGRVASAVEALTARMARVETVLQIPPAKKANFR